MELKNGTSKPFKSGDKVVYIPKYLLKKENHKDMMKEKNLGIVTSKNDRFVFVRYKGNKNSQATSPTDLYSLDNRPDLANLVSEID